MQGRHQLITREAPDWIEGGTRSSEGVNQINPREAPDDLREASDPWNGAPEMLQWVCRISGVGTKHVWWGTRLHSGEPEKTREENGTCNIICQCLGISAQRLKRCRLASGHHVEEMAERTLDQLLAEMLALQIREIKPVGDSNLCVSRPGLKP